MLTAPVGAVAADLRFRAIGLGTGEVTAADLDISTVLLDLVSFAVAPVRRSRRSRPSPVDPSRFGGIVLAVFADLLFLPTS